MGIVFSRGSMIDQEKERKAWRSLSVPLRSTSTQSRSVAHSRSYFICRSFGYLKNCISSIVNFWIKLGTGKVKRPQDMHYCTLPTSCPNNVENSPTVRSITMSPIHESSKSKSFSEKCVHRVTDLELSHRTVFPQYKQRHETSGCIRYEVRVHHEDSRADTTIARPLCSRRQKERQLEAKRAEIVLKKARKRHLQETYVKWAGILQEDSNELLKIWQSKYGAEEARARMSEMISEAKMEGFVRVSVRRH